MFDVLGAVWGKEADSAIIHHIYLHLIPIFSLSITLFSTMPGLPESETCLVRFLQRTNPCSPVRVLKVTDTWVVQDGRGAQAPSLFLALHLSLSAAGAINTRPLAQVLPLWQVSSVAPFLFSLI